MRFDLWLVLASVAGCTTSPAPTKHVFITSGDYQGDLVTAAGDPSLDGPVAADLICNQSAASAHRGGTWTAWISVGDGSNLADPTTPKFLQAYPHASYRVAAIDRIVGDGPWFNLSNQFGERSEAELFADRQALVTGASGDIFYDEYGQLPTGQTGVTTWTGTRTDGQPTSWDCSGWTTTTVDLSAQGYDPAAPNLGVAGAEYDSSDLIEIGPTWTDDANMGCNDTGDVDSPRCASDPTRVPANKDAMGWGTLSCTRFAKLYCFEN
jgi:hypothetical protein